MASSAPRRIGRALPYLLLLILTFAALGFSNLALGTMVISPSRVPFGLPARVFSGFMSLCWGLYGSAWVVLIGCTVAAITHHWRSMRLELNLLGGLLGFSLLLNLVDVNLHLSSGNVKGLVLLYEGIVAQVLDYDYAPSSEIVESRRMYFNMSQVLEVQVSNMMPHQSESPWLPLHLTLGPTHE